ncbi:hypothetical protein AGLY_005391 [Aphis glycines]|uniref:Uncharacterized protein n=1 Tax=Aphis glycines TaxID=307491 RepID=A0A6G0TW64_APHGL|nr:hypothetical protein AGLY_005391 [Aphis glycines]
MSKNCLAVRLGVYIYMFYFVAFCRLPFFGEIFVKELLKVMILCLVKILDNSLYFCFCDDRRFYVYRTLRSLNLLEFKRTYLAVRVGNAFTNHLDTMVHRKKVGKWVPLCCTLGGGVDLGLGITYEELCIKFTTSIKTTHKEPSIKFSKLFGHPKIFYRHFQKKSKISVIPLTLTFGENFNYTLNIIKLKMNNNNGQLPIFIQFLLAIDYTLIFRLHYISNTIYEIDEFLKIRLFILFILKMSLLSFEIYSYFNSQNLSSSLASL